MSTTVRTSSISPPPGQQDQSARLAASAEVGQVEGTNRELSDEELANVLACALRVVELRAVRRVVGVEEFKRLGLSIDLRLAERLVLIHADWLLEQGA